MDTIDALNANFRSLFYNNLLPAGDEEITEKFLQRILKIMLVFIKNNFDRSEKIINFHHPAELQKILPLEIENEPQNLEKILEDCELILNKVVKTGNPRFFNQFYQGLDIVSMVGEWLSTVTNTNIHTYETSPVWIVMEKYIFKRLSEIIGWNGEGDGVMTPGGSLANLYGVQLARHFYYPHTKTDGLFNMPKLIIFTSQQSHYSMKRAAAILGFGTNQVREVPVDEGGRILPDALEKMIIETKENEEIPLVVSLTSGTTVLGAFDPINPVADICEKHKLWLHVDAAWGGGILFSRKHKHLMDGIHRADSILWNPHKMMGSILQTSIFLVKNTEILMSCNSMNASYLFQKDKFYDTSFDIGDKTIQCGRHVDIMKFWIMWKAKGDSGLENHVDKLYELSYYFQDILKTHPNFALVLEKPQCTNICFWYIPDSLKALDKNSKEYKEKLHYVAPKIKQKMILDGTMMIGYQPLGDKPNFFRIVFSNYGTEKCDLDFVVNEIHRLGKDL